MNPDVALFHLLNNLAGRWPILDWLVRALVNDFFIPTVASLVLAWLWLSGTTEEERRLNQRAVLFMFLGMLLAQAAIKGMSFIYFRPRPFATEAVNLLFYRPSVSSFPSVPIALVCSFGMGAMYASRRAATVLFSLGILYGLARIVAGVHYPLDILGGAAIGTAAAIAVARLEWLRPLLDACTRLVRRSVFA